MRKIVVKALIRNQDGRLLFLHRSMSHPNFPGHLDLPGGEVEGGESVAGAIIREIREETGIVCNPNQINKAFEIRHPNATHVLYIVTLKDNGTLVSLSWEHKGCEWLNCQEIIMRGTDDSMDPYYLDVFNYLVEKCS